MSKVVTKSSDLKEFLGRFDGQFDPVYDGKIHRFGKTKSGWYAAHKGDGYDLIIAGDFAMYGEEQFVYCSRQRFSEQQKQEYSAFMKAVKETREAEKKQYQQEMKTVSSDVKNHTLDVTVEEFPYTSKKKIDQLYGAFFSQDNDGVFLAVPMTDVNGEVWNYQRIYSDGAKKFKPGKVTGVFHTIGDLTDASTVYVCEGFATGVSVHKATKAPVLVCFSAHNVYSTLFELKESGRLDALTVIVAADNDCHIKETEPGKKVNTTNAGIETAIKVRERLGYEFIAPQFSDTIKDKRLTDFNDVETEFGLEVLTKVIEGEDTELVGLKRSVEQEKLDIFKREVEQAKRLTQFIYFEEVDTPSGPKQKKISLYREMGLHYLGWNKYYYSDHYEMEWTKTHWENVGKSYLDSEVAKVIGGTLGPNQAPIFSKHIRMYCHDRFFEKKDATGKINLLNGVLDVRTGELEPHDHRYFFKTVVPINYREANHHPLWTEFLNTVFDGDFERMSCLQQMAGYILIGGKPFLQKAFALYGDGRNGKSVFLNVLKKLLGQNSCSHLSLKAFGEKFETVCLDGKLANISTDEGDDFKVSIGAFKAAVSGEPIMVQQKGKPAYSIDVNARFIFSCNKMPYFGDRSHAISDRLIIIPFDRLFLEADKDPFLEDKLTKELPGILNWAIEGAHQVLKSSGIIVPKASEAAKTEFFEESDPLLVWAKENLEFAGLEHFLSPGELYEHYRGCMNMDGVHNRLSKIGFCRELRRLIRMHYAEENGGKIPEKLSRVTKENGKTTRQMVGVKWVPVRREVSRLQII